MCRNPVKGKLEAAVCVSTRIAAVSYVNKCLSECPHCK